MPINYNDIFRSDSIADQYRLNGYAILQMGDLQPVQDLQVFHKENFKKDISGLYASHNANSYERNKDISNKIEEATLPFINSNFNNVQFILGHYMIKASTNGDEFQLHQDWSVTDESKHFSAHLWIPLQDTNKDNGTMYVIPGSHLYYKNYRSGSLDIPRINRDELVDKMIIPLNIKKGEFLIYHPALFHGSFANRSKNDRIAVLVSLIDKRDTLKYYHLPDENATKIEVHEISPETILRELVELEKARPPINSKPVKTINANSFNNRELNSKMVFDKFSELHPNKGKTKKNPSIFKKFIR